MILGGALRVRVTATSSRVTASRKLSAPTLSDFCSKPSFPGRTWDDHVDNRLTTGASTWDEFAYFDKIDNKGSYEKNDTDSYSGGVRTTNTTIKEQYKRTESTGFLNITDITDSGHIILAVKSNGTTVDTFGDPSATESFTVTNNGQTLTAVSGSLKDVVDYTLTEPSESINYHAVTTQTSSFSLADDGAGVLVTSDLESTDPSSWDPEDGGVLGTQTDVIGYGILYTRIANPNHSFEGVTTFSQHEWSLPNQWLIELSGWYDSAVEYVSTAYQSVTNYITQIYATFSADPWGATVDLAIGFADGLVHTIIPPIPFLGELPHLGPLYGHDNVFGLGSGIGTVAGVAGGILIGNVASGASGLVACGRFAQQAASLYTKADTILGVANAVVNIAQNGSVGIGDVLGLAPALGWGLGKLSGKQFCFFAGTTVATEHGDRPIEAIQKGDRVWSCDLKTGEWVLCTATDTQSFEYEGDKITVSVAGDRIETINHHPFWVVRGKNLDARPTPEHVAKAMVPDTKVAGRWVDSCDLLAGDVLFLRDGRQVPIDEIDYQPAHAPVYNFTVEPLHNYAVGHAHVLVHNSSCTAAPSSNPAKGRFDSIHSGSGAFDSALEAARRNAGDLGSSTKKMFDPHTGTLIGEMSANGKRGWRIDNDHINFWDWSLGKKGSGGRYGHEYFPAAQNGPYSLFPGFAPWL